MTPVPSRNPHRNRRVTPGSPTVSRAILVVGLFVAAALVASPVLAGAHGWPGDTPGWTVYGGSNAHTGVSPAVGPSKAKQVANPVALGGPSFTAPVADADGNLYVGDDTGQVTKLRPDFAVEWTVDLPVDAPIRGSLLVGPDGTVYVAPVAEHMYAYDGETGEPVQTPEGEEWKARIRNTADDGDYVLTSAPVYHPDGSVIVGSMDGHVYAVSPVTAKVLWKFKTDPPRTSEGFDYVPTPVAIGDDGAVFATAQNGYLYKLDPETGKKVWHAKAHDLADRVSTLVKEEQIVAAPSLGPDGRVYVTTRLKRELAGMVYAFDDKGDTVEKVWTRQLNEKITAPVTVDGDDGLYVGALDGTFYRLAPSDGAIVWDFHPQDDDPGVYDKVGARSQTTNPLAVAELAVLDGAGRVYVPYWHVDLTKGFPPQGSEPSPLYALKAEDGSITWRTTFDKTIRSPALVPVPGAETGGRAQGVLYLAGDDGRMYAFGDVAPPVTPEDADVEAQAPEEPEPAPTGDGGGKGDAGNGDGGTGAKNGTDGDETPTDDEGEGDRELLAGPAAGLLVLTLLGLAGAVRPPRRRA